MSFPKTLTAELAYLGCAEVGHLRFQLPSEMDKIQWQLSFRALGFSKDQVDGATSYRHNTATDFSSMCLSRYAGAWWKQSLKTAPQKKFSGGFAIGPLAGWRSNHTIDNRNLSPDETAVRVAEDVQRTVLPRLACLTTDDQLFEFLCQDTEPFPWFRSQPLTRIAEVFHLANRLGQPESTYLTLVETHRQLLQDQLPDLTVSQYINNVLSALRGDG
jgi:hypothetical protein